ncbi:MAG: hypothetical protein AAB441_05135 [Patescibacteria group bacterium]
MTKQTQKLMSVYLDLENNRTLSNLNDDDCSELILGKFELNKNNIGKRYKSSPSLGISYDTESVRLYHQAKELYCLGYFESTIMVCRATAEYLAFEIFVEQIDLQGERKQIETIAENLDFRKIVNNFLVKGIKPLIDNDSKDLFNQLYDLGNNWIHPKEKQEDLNVEKEAEKAFLLLGKLMQSLRNVLFDYEIVKGVLTRKQNSRKYYRGIKLAQSNNKNEK